LVAWLSRVRRVVAYYEWRVDALPLDGSASCADAVGRGPCWPCGYRGTRRLYGELPPSLNIGGVGLCPWRRSTSRADAVGRGTCWPRGYCPYDELPYKRRSWRLITSSAKLARLRLHARETSEQFVAEVYHGTICPRRHVVCEQQVHEEVVIGRAAYYSVFSLPWVTPKGG
jgi:hypothetical protein